MNYGAVADATTADPRRTGVTPPEPRPTDAVFAYMAKNTSAMHSIASTLRGALERLDGEPALTSGAAMPANPTPLGFLGAMAREIAEQESVLADIAALVARLDRTV